MQQAYSYAQPQQSLDSYELTAKDTMEIYKPRRLYRGWSWDYSQRYVKLLGCYFGIVYIPYYLVGFRITITI